MCQNVSRSEGHYLSLLENNTGGMNCVFHEPITCSVKFDIFSKKYAAVQAGVSILE